MLTILIAAVLIVGVAAVAICAHPHHHRTVVIERPVYIQAQVYLIQAQITLAEANKRPEPVRLPVARLLNPSKAIERYRSQERKPS